MYVRTEVYYMHRVVCGNEQTPTAVPTMIGAGRSAKCIQKPVVHVRRKIRMTGF